MNKLIQEASRTELINKSKNAQKTKSYGTTRYVRRTKSRISPSVKNYNRIDMNALFKGDLLSFKVPIIGEKGNYEVELLFEGFLKHLQKYVKKDGNKVEFKTVLRAILDAFNDDDVYISCSCPDWQYRMAYFATKDRHNSGKPELRPSDITNPDNKLGAGCKHSMLVLANLSWAMKVASVIRNYINYAEKNMQKAYADIIFPAIYGMSYKKAIQTGLFDSDELDNTMDNKEQEQDIDNINDVQGKSGRFKKGEIVNNQKINPKKEPKEPTEPLDIEGEE